MNVKRPQKSPQSLLSRVLDAGVENFTVDEEPKWNATLTFPGLGFESADRDGNPTMQSIMLMMGLCRWYSLNVPYDDYGSIFLDWTSLTKDRFVFASSTEIIVSRKMYDRRVNKKKFNGKFMLGHIGNSSVTSLSRVHVPGDSIPVLEQTFSIVTVSKETRKPIALPEWYKERYEGKGEMDTYFRMKPLERPNITFVHKVKVAWSETDTYNHTNFSSYVRYAVDALHAALSRSSGKRVDQEMADSGSAANHEHRANDGDSCALKGVTKEIILNGLRNVKILYLKECLEGQMLDAHIWQDPEAPLVVNCAIESESGHEDICHLILEYFDLEDSA